LPKLRGASHRWLRMCGPFRTVSAIPVPANR
jgi:hypothetical protein